MASLVLTGLAFTASKAVPAGAQAAATLWSAVRGPAQFLADPTDLPAPRRFYRVVLRTASICWAVGALPFLLTLLTAYVL